MSKNRECVKKILFTDEDRKFMFLAIEEASRAFANDEVPIGAVLVIDHQVISTGRNNVETKQRATAHAEIECIHNATKKIGNWRLLNATMYVTIEPCIMCIGALTLSRVKRVVWGAPDPRHGGCKSLLDIEEIKHPIHQVEVEGGLLEEESKALMKQFFKQKR